MQANSAIAWLCWCGDEGTCATTEEMEIGNDRLAAIHDLIGYFNPTRLVEIGIGDAIAMLVNKLG